MSHTSSLTRRLFGGAAAALILAGGLPSIAQETTATLPSGFESTTAAVNGVTLHYVRGGAGKPVVLLHGFPQNWSIWSEIAPILANAGYDVIAVDLRGSGASSAPATGYDKETLARDVNALVQSLGLEDVAFVGHDIGAMVSFTHAALFAEDTRAAVLIEAPIPDQTVFAFPAITPQGAGAWHMGFFTVKDIPEMLVAGKEEAFIRAFIDSLVADPASVPDAHVAEYARHFAKPGHTSAAFEYFRTFPQDAAAIAARPVKEVTVPLLALGAERSLGGFVLEQAQGYGASVTGGIVPDVGHWIPEENPSGLAQRIIAFLSAVE